MKVVHCHEVGFDCDQVVSAESEEEVLRQAAEHIQIAHGVLLTPELTAQVQRLVSDELSDEELEQAVGGGLLSEVGLPALDAASKE